MKAFRHVMSRFNTGIAQVQRDESAVTAIEYALIAALIGIVIIGGATQLGGNIRDKFYQIGNDINNAGNNK